MELTSKSYSDEKVVQKYTEHIPQDYETVYKFIDKFLSNLKPNSLIFEIGSATGRDAQYIKEKGYRIIVSDVSDAFIKILSKVQNEVQKFDVLSDRLPDGISAVYANSVFHHFSNDTLKTVLSNFYKQLSDGGILAFITRAGDFEGIINEKVDSPRFFKYRTEAEMKELITSSGFNLIYSHIVKNNEGNFLQFIVSRGE